MTKTTATNSLPAPQAPNSSLAFNTNRSHPRSLLSGIDISCTSRPFVTDEPYPAIQLSSAHKRRWLQSFALALVNTVETPDVIQYMMRTRWSAYAGVSLALAGGVVVKALAQRPNFYSAAVYLSQSSANLMILTNMVFVAACTLLLGLQKLLYGPLRPIEIEQLSERAWFAVTETCLAMTIFRGEIGAWFLVMFFALLTGKVWAWIGEGRVEILEQQPPRNPRLFHTRLALSLGLSVIFNLSMLEYLVKEVMHMARPDMMVMFGFEFAVLSIVSLSTAARYAINLVEIGIVRKQKAIRAAEIRKERIDAATRTAQQNLEQGTPDPSNAGISDSNDDATRSRNLMAANTVTEAILAAGRQPIDDSDLEVEGWEGKGRWIFYLDLATDFFKLVVYLSFFFILLIFYGLPIHILRDVFMTCRSFFKRITDFMRYRTATRDMNERYPDATEQDFGRDDVCIICREDMRPYVPEADGRQPNPVAERMRPKKLPCGHVLHFSCLRSWLERQQICPTCRTSVVPTAQTRAGPNAGTAPPGANAQHGNAPGQNGLRARVYQLGPLRIGVGAARGNNMLENLQQQLGNGAQPPQPANPDGPQQFGFGIRWEGRRRTERPVRAHRAVQDQLNTVERQIQQEINSLDASLAEVQVLRNMEAELSRIRQQRQTAGQTQSATQQAAALSGNMAPSVTPMVGNSQQVLHAGSEDLPAGLTLPDGWTMMPLQPAHGLMPPMPLQNLPPMTNGAANPVSAMFTMPGRAPQVGGTFQQMHMFGQPQGTQTSTQGTGLAMTEPSFGSATAPASNEPVNDIGSVARSMAEIVAERTRSMHFRPPPQSAQEPASDTQPSSNIDQGRPHSTGPVTVVDSQSVSAPTRADEPLLPVWGSPATTDTEGATSSLRRELGEHVNGRDAQTTQQGASSSTDHLQSDDESSSTTRKRNPTVEDLVEDPD